jgi:hypothetical protein
MVGNLSREVQKRIEKEIIGEVVCEIAKLFESFFEAFQICSRKISPKVIQTAEEIVMEARKKMP